MWITKPGPAWGFAEDVCYLPEGGGVIDCTPLPEACEPLGTTSEACLAAAAAAFVAQQQSYDGGRSSIHVDATYLMAMAVGFSSEHAYWISAYDEAIDLGWYEPRDLAGAPVGDGALRTATLDGLVRSNLPSGGVYFHFVAPRNGGQATPAGDIDGLHPDLEDPEVEVLLVHLRAWALAGAGAEPACVHGLTDDGGCFGAVTGDPSTIVGRLALLADTLNAPFRVDTGSQTIVTAAAEGGAQTSEAFDQVVGGPTGRSADARLGVYLHALGDRISHHICTDQAAVAGPAPGPGQRFAVDLGNPDCAQGSHALRHMWEIGVEYGALPPAEQTVEAALTAIYDELAMFAEARGMLAPGADAPAARDALLAELLTALQIAGAAERVDALAAIGCARDFEAMPGMPACGSPPAASDAGVVSPPEPPTGCGCQGGADPGALAGALALLALLARRRYSMRVRGVNMLSR